jgi:hypothetical protein
MITILTAFKPFKGEALMHQTNALRSWTALGRDVEILVFGEPRVFGPAVEPFGARVVPDVPTGEDGRARVDAIFEFGKLHGKFNRQVYVNGDIILMQDFVAAFQSIPFYKFLMVGQRMDVDVTEALSFDTPEAARVVHEKLCQSGVLHEPWGLDYFAYSRGSLPALPPLYVGAAAWDNLMIYFCRRARLPVVDATFGVTAFHQNHAYDATTRECPSARANRSLLPEPSCVFGAIDATHWLDHGRMRNALSSRRYAFRMISRYPVANAWPRPLRVPFRLAAAVWKRMGYA